MKTLEHKSLALSITLADMTQEQLENYQALLAAGSELKSAAAFNSLIVRSAIEAGFLTGVTKEALPAMKPAAVRWMTAQVLEHVKAEQEIPNS